MVTVSCSRRFVPLGDPESNHDFFELGFAFQTSLSYTVRGRFPASCVAFTSPHVRTHGAAESDLATFFLESGLFIARDYSSTMPNYKHTMTKCQIVGDLPSALSGVLEPGQRPGVRIKCQFTHTPWCRGSVGLRKCDHLRARAQHPHTH